MAIAHGPSQQPAHKFFHTHSLLFKACKILLLASLVSSVIVIIYLYPSLFSVLTETMPQFWMVLEGWFTAPILFILMNLVVGAVYITSGMMHRAKKGNAAVLEESDEVETELSDNEELPSMSAVKDISGRVELEERSALRRDEKSSVSARSQGKLFVPPHVRLVRSKSDQILPPKKPDFLASRLRKAGTFESTSSTKPTSGVVVVADPPVDDTVTDAEEVDKKAEDFIGRFYQQMKLQRLDSFLRYKDRIDRSHG